MSYNNFRLFLISFAMLFIEMFLIRWISTEIRIFAYVSNLVLLACFLGIGIGCYFSKKRANVLVTICTLALISLSVHLWPFKKITTLLSGFSDSVIWYQSLKAGNLIFASIGTAFTLMMFAMILIAFIPLGQILSRLLDEHTNIIIGYSVNVVASIIGIWVFNLFSLFYTPPGVWFLASLITLLFFIPKNKVNLFITFSCATVIILSTYVYNKFTNSLLVRWSPYQKLDIRRNDIDGIANGYMININNVGYMSLLNLSDDFIRQHIRLYSDLGNKKYNQYELPYLFVDRKDAVLIVGAGGGNDAAGALRSGVKDIDAVEIDPGIYTLGLQFHPEKPYSNHNVNVIVDDARAFFKKEKKRYDIISFGLLDSHTSSMYNNIRLDHYVYTEESFQDARKLLKDDGVISVIFASQRPWIADRIYGLLKKVYGDVPYAFNVRLASHYGGGGCMFITGNNLAKLKKLVDSQPDLKNFINKNSMKLPGNTKLTTDNWPYLYIEKASIPRMYILIILSLLALLLIAKRFLTSLQDGQINMHFFFLGCAFLLLEFQNVSKAALLFGATWIVNSYIISAILLLIVMANLFVYYSKRDNTNIFYFLLLMSTAVVYFVPLDIFNIFGYWMKLVLATIFLNIPIFFAGVIFINSFKNTPSKDIALASNLIGSTVGGILQTMSFITGIRALLVVVFLLYLMSYFYLKRERMEMAIGHIT